MLALATMNDGGLDLSIIIPALNEEAAILAVIKSVREATSQLGVTFELILVNDGSTDRTGELMENFAREEKSIQASIIHNPTPQNIGHAFWQGVQKARGRYVILVAGDNEITKEALINIFSEIGKYDLVISYPTKTEIRSWQRRVISQVYVFIFNTLFKVRLRYFNGSCLIRTDLAKSLLQWTRGFAYMSEILIQLVRKGVTYKEVPAPLQPRLGGASKPVNLKNIMLVAGTIGKLWWRIYFKS